MSSDRKGRKPVGSPPACRGFRKWFLGPPMAAAALFLILPVCALLLGCARSGQPEKVKIAVASLGLSAPVYVAADQGYFRQEGLDVSLLPTLTGTDALRIAMDGKADIATSAETPVMRTIMEGGKVYLLATIGSAENMNAVIARRDRGISRPEDLAGKTMGVPPVTNMEYFLDTFLLDHGVSREKRRIAQVKVDEMGKALKDGVIDAACIWEPHLTALRGESGPAGVVFYGTGAYRLTWHMAARQDYVQAHPGTIEKVLRALIRARGFIIEHPAFAMRITAARLGVDQGILSPSWKGFNFNITLSQSVLVSLQDQAGWVLRRKGSGAADLPDFLGAFYLKGLESIDPTLVSVEH